MREQIQRHYADILASEKAQKTTSDAALRLNDRKNRDF